MKKNKNIDKIKIVRGKLLQKGLSIEDFARQNNFNPWTVRTVLRRYVHTDQRPSQKNADQSRAILQKLEPYIR